jgi:hypothetical protein
MQKLKEIIKKVDSVDVLLFTAMGLYGTLLIVNLSKLFY